MQAWIVQKEFYFVYLLLCITVNSTSFICISEERNLQTIANTSQNICARKGKTDDNNTKKTTTLLLIPYTVEVASN